MNGMNIRRLEQRLINANSKNNSNKPKTKDFGEILDVLNEKEIKFSKHARERLVSRNMDLNDQDLIKLNSAFDRAKEKGVKDALFLMDDQAFIGNIQNRTIITAIEQDRLKDNIFTNIDGAVII